MYYSHYVTHDMDWTKNQCCSCTNSCGVMSSCLPMKPTSPHNSPGVSSVRCWHVPCLWSHTHSQSGTSCKWYTDNGPTFGRGRGLPLRHRCFLSTKFSREQCPSHWNRNIPISLHASCNSHAGNMYNYKSVTSLMCLWRTKKCSAELT